MRTIELQIIRHDVADIIVGGRYAGSNHRILPCSCVAQAYMTAVRGRPDPSDLISVVDHHGDPVALADLPTCRVTPAVWTWAHHGHTHRPRPELAGKGAAR